VVGKGNHTWRRYPHGEEIRSGSPTDKIAEEFFSGYKAKTGIPYTLISEHEASGIYGPQTLEMPG
jgi:hypothetical protein